MGSFLDFSRMTPRERMLMGLRGQLSPTFGLEVGSPRAQLGVVPLAGLGRDGRFGALGVEENEAGLNPGLYPTTNTMLLADPLVNAGATLATPLAERSTLTAFRTGGSSLLATSTPAAPEASAPVYSPTRVARTSTSGVVRLETPTTAQLTSDDEPGGGGVLDEERDAYEYDAGSGQRVTEGEFDDYDGWDQEADPWGEAYGGGAQDTASGGANADAFDVDVERTKRIRSPATGAEMFWQKASPYLPWVLGGGALVGLAYMLGKKKG